ncbi:MerR family transcriptional regulator [Actinomadura vinacea]|uniref:MerR family transcriptional regulator n=1 Tax=Actinomadura vinacea TaxID=115336 RepID=A0ABN3K4P1_9ACTN
MRIGELAALVGVSTRTVRHYHHLDLLPEPQRRANGYREYGLRDAVALARIRRLAELGLSLDEIRDVLADDANRELREVLLELDGDLARQQEAIAARRARLAALLAETDLNPDSTVSPDLAAMLRALPSGNSAFAEFDREMLRLIDTGSDPADRAELFELFKPLTEPDAVERGHDLNRRLDELAGARPDDPRVAVLAADLADHFPAEMTAMMLEHLGPPDGDALAPHQIEGAAWLDMMLAELPPAQAETFRLLLAILKGRR